MLTEDQLVIGAIIGTKGCVLNYEVTNIIDDICFLMLGGDQLYSWSKETLLNETALEIISLPDMKASYEKEARVLEEEIGKLNERLALVRKKLQEYEPKPSVAPQKEAAKPYSLLEID